ncbi:peptidylprolyl isomerase [Sporohalobacter salinus]|uniref:peptidylprolyl isomerase n=1 Tax=Sporohalobacter salinus TaxID=1494606 RepID=UPI001961B894|nr:peptidylprolyl isomerase [Sporohalobacter salinus]MBM7623227.1 parvulin-like peptidyl-prolyl isomerase [Sporohalobacter salinus]
MIFDNLRNNSRILIYIVIIAFVGGGVLVGLSGYFTNSSNTPSQNQAAHAQQRKKNIAVVNGEQISYSDFQRGLQRFQQRSRRQIGNSQVLTIKNRVLQQMIDQRLLLQKAKEKDIKVKVSDKEVDTQLNKWIDSTSKSRDEIEKLLKDKGSSMTKIKEQLRKGMKKQRTLQKMIQQTQDDVEITDKELKNAYEKVTASHILIKTDERSDKKAKAKAEKILAEVKNGKDFSKAAKEYSEGPSGEKGGKLGTFGHGKMVPGFEKVAFNLKKGEISQPVKTKFGYHIIKVIDRKEAEGKEFTKAKPKLKKKLKQKKGKQAVEQLINNYREEADIEINSAELKAYRAAQNDNYEKAVTEYNKALNQGRTGAYVYSGLAQAYQQQDKKDKAIEIYKKAIEKSPEDSQIRFALSTLYQQTGKKDKAVKQLDKVAESAGDNLLVHYRLQALYKKLGHEKKAKEEMEKVKKLQKKASEKRKQLQKKARKQQKQQKKQKTE